MTNEERVSGLRRHVARGRRDRGQSLIEFALVLPMLLVLFFGIIEFGNAWRIYQLVTNTAREGAREAVLPSSTTFTVDSIIDERLNGSGLDASQATVILGICSGDGCRGNPDSVRIDYPYQFVVLGPVIQLMCGGVGCDGSAYSTVNLSSTAIMRNE
jgi:hypothetical protein